MRRLAIVAALVAAASNAIADGLVEAGRLIVEVNCSGCHAIGADDASRHPVAPPFRGLSARYPIDALEEAFAEGIYVGHPDMPEFEATPEQIAAIIAYLETIQTAR